MTDFTPATRPHDGGEEPLLDSFLREAIPEIKLSLGDAIDRDNSRAIPDKYVKMLPLTTLVVTLRPDAAQAVAVMAAELEEELTDSVMRHGSLYDRDYRVRLKEAGTRGRAALPRERAARRPAGAGADRRRAAASAAPGAAGRSRRSPRRSRAVRPRRPPGETLFAGRSPDLMDPDATRVEGIAAPPPPAPARADLAGLPGRPLRAAGGRRGRDGARALSHHPGAVHGRPADGQPRAAQRHAAHRLRPTVSRRQLALVWAEREGRPGFTVYNLGLNAIHVGDREVSGANAGKGALDIAGMGEHSTWVAPGEAIRIGGHGPIVRINDGGGGEGAGGRRRGRAGDQRRAAGGSRTRRSSGNGGTKVRGTKVRVRKRCERTGRAKRLASEKRTIVPSNLRTLSSGRG